MTKKAMPKKVEKKLLLEKLIYQDKKLLAKNCKYFDKIITFEDAIRHFFSSKKIVEKLKAKTIRSAFCASNKAGEVKLEFIFSNDYVLKKSADFTKKLLEDLLKEDRIHKC